MRTEPEDRAEVPRAEPHARVRSRFRDVLPILALLGLSVSLLFWKLGTTSFHDADEGQYAQCAQEMIESGDYATIHFGGQPFFEKPPAKIWLIALGYRLLGVNEWGARLSSALFALGTVLLTVALGRALLGPTAAVLAGTILVSSPQFLHEHCARTCEYEPETAFFFTLSMLCLHRTTSDRRWLVALGVALGCLSLVKGPVALPALAIAVVYLLVHRPRVSLGVALPGLALLTFLVIALPWPVHQLVTHGTAFKEMYLDAQIVGRLTGKPPSELAGVVQGLRSEGVLAFYPTVLFVGMFPWSVATAPALALLVVGAVRRWTGHRLLLLWIVVFLVTIFVARGKFAWYAVPLLPALALTIASFVRWLATTASHRLSYGIGLVVLVASLLFVPSPAYDPYGRVSAGWPTEGANLIPITQISHGHAGSWLPVTMTGVLAIGAALAWATMRRRRGRGDPRTAFTFIVIGSLVISGICHAALPLRGADHRSELARCKDAVDRLGVVPTRAVIVDEVTFERGARFTAFFYLYAMSGGSKGRIVRMRLDPAARIPPGILTPGAVLLGGRRFGPRFLDVHGLVELWRGETIVAFYVPDE